MVKMDHAESVEMDHAESVATVVVEGVEAGSRMKYQAEQSHGEHDFDLVYPDGRIAALEVTAATDESAERMLGALRDKRKGGPSVPTKFCKKGWFVHTKTDARINSVRKDVDAYLADIENDGITRFFSSMDAAKYTSVAKIWRDLRIEAGSVMDWTPPDQIRISLPGGGGAVSVSALTEAVLKEAQKMDNRRKLGAAQTKEKHLFVHVHGRYYLPWVALVDLDPPPEAVTLPAEITHVWAATEDRSGDEYVVWRAFQNAPWQNCGPVAISGSA